MIFHHDHEHVIQVRNALGDRAFGTEHRPHHCDHQQRQNWGLVLHVSHISLQETVAEW